MEEPKIKHVGNIGGVNTQSRSVYTSDGLSPTLTACAEKGNTIPYVVQKEQVICAMRGRNPDNPSDRTPGIELEQTLEINSEGIANTLTTVQKDNLVLESESISLNPMEDGTCRCLKNQYGKNSIPNFESQGTWGGYRSCSCQAGNNGRYHPLQNWGGGRPELPRQQDKTRTSNRERRSLSDSDNGEYP